MTKSDSSLERPPPVRKSGDWKNFVAGGFVFCTSTLLLTFCSAGGCMGALLTCPLEVVKTRFQSLNGLPLASKPPYIPSFVYAFKVIVEKEGVKGLFRGLAPNLVGVAPSRYVRYHT